MAFCINCGKNLEQGQIFCDACGTKQESPIPIVEPATLQNEVTKKVNILLIVSAVLLALGTLLPCYTVSFFGMSESVSYIQGDGVIVLIAAVISVVLAFVKKEVFAVIPGVVSIALLINLCSGMSEFGMGSYNIGMYLMWIGAVATCVTPFIKKK